MTTENMFNQIINDAIYQDFVSNELVDYFLEMMTQCKTENHLEDTLGNNLYTIGGIQTKNIVPMVRDSVFLELNNKISDYMRLYYDRNLEYFRYFVNHIHIIEYDPGGYQKKHTHHRTEDHSFIINLNDSDGKTRFYIDENPIDIESKKRNISLFNSSFLHEGLTCTDKRFVAVGAISFLHKIWRN